MGENMLASQDSFSIIPQIHPFVYLPDYSTTLAWKSTINMTWNSYDINGHKFSLTFP